MWTQNNDYLTLLPAAAVTTTSASPATYVDLATDAALVKREVTAVILQGAMTTATTLTFSIKECATTNGTYTAPPLGTVSAVSTTTTANLIKIQYVPTLRYQHLEITVNATGSIPIGATLVAMKREA